MDNTQIVFSISDRINCTYYYRIVKNIRNGKATILVLSNTGVIMITKDFLKPKREVRIVIDKPLGPLELTVEVLSSKPEWYFTDKNKDMFFTVRTVFKNISSAEKARVIKYIYDCKVERHKARTRRMKQQ